ncbi:MAG: AAA family ATPase [Rhodopila sp.]
MELLLRRWTHVKDGKGRVVLISAEPGVGKSRLAETLAERITDEPHIRLRWFCSAHHQDSALYPVIAQMERAAGFAHGNAPEVRLAKLQALLVATAPPPEDVALIAELHGLPSAGLASLEDFTPQRRKAKTFEALLRQLEGLARQQPVPMTFDDLHWIDPSTHELLDRLVERIVNWPVLLLGLFRPEFQPPWVGQPHVTMLTLARLDRDETMALVAVVAGDAVLPAAIKAEIAERTDGVPLFIEELAKAVLEAGAQAPAALSAMPHPALSVPPTLHASLMARLDRLGPAAREVAQVGAAIGREFSQALLALIADMPEPQMREALNRLVDAGLVFVRGTPPEASYLFKHALVQDTAYGSLLRSHRQSLHRRIVAALEEWFPETIQTQPALLAQHCQEAGLVEQAAVHWLAASQQALARWALAEAAAQARKGLAVVTGLPNNPRRAQQELDLQTVLGTALSSTRGWAVAEVVETFARARMLAEQLDRPEHLLPLLHGQWGVHLTRGEHRLALSLSEQIENIGKVRNDVSLQVACRLLQGVSCFFLGELVIARAFLEEHADPAHTPTDPWPAYFHVIRLGSLGRTLAHLGHIDQARSRTDQALSLARQIGSAPVLSVVFIFANTLDHVIGSRLRHADELLAVATEQKLPQWLAWALMFQGHALAARGQTQEAFALLSQALAHLRTIGAVSGQPGLLASLAAVSTRLGQPSEAWRYLNEAAQIIEATDERVSEAGVLYRVPGDLLNAAGDQFGAEQRYRQAIAVAERQSAKLYQLRASTSLARLWRDQGRRAEAHDLLAPIYGWFTEGLDAPVLKEAKALLDELA